MLQSLTFRREVDRRRQSHPKVHAFYRGRLDVHQSAQMLPVLERFGTPLFDTMERALDDMMALGPERGLPGTDVQAFLDALHQQTGALPHDEDFEAFEDVVETFYSQPLYPLLEHAMFLHPVGLERVRQVLERTPERFERVADVAVGPAAILGEILRARPGTSAAAFDISSPCVSYARAALSRGPLAGRAEVTEADARALPVDDGAFDFVVATEVIEHVPNPEVLVAELARVVRPGGALVASVPLELPWGAHLATFETEEEARALFDSSFENESFERVPFGAGASLCFGRWRRR